ncbi:MAG: hypothetical protein HYV52_02865 [Parcubacteria group bacterium]|nr:hypothetical protein [Parcubacteria group bacterium]
MLMKIIFQTISNKKLYFSSILAVGIISVTVLFSQSSNPEPFRPIEDFVLFGKEGVHLSEDIQSLSGDIGSNKEIKIAEKSKIVGNLFSQEIKLTENTEIDGNITTQQLEQTSTTKILGTISKEISFPIAQIPDIPDFQIGTQDIEITQKDFILPSGSFRDIRVKENASLIMAGIYNLRSLRLENNSVILFNGLTILNIRNSFELGQDIIVTPKLSSLSVKEIKINTLVSETIHIGNRSILGFRLIAPNAVVEIGEEGLLRGSIWAREVEIEKNALVSKEDSFEKESDPTKVVEDQGVKFIGNEILILFKNEATQSAIQQVVNLINGKVVGFIPNPLIVKIEVQTITLQDLNDKIQLIKNLNNPLIVGVMQNLLAN